ncbi:MAG TPA: hypothetical protein VFA22_12280 [Stellaceae bacterium]|nr:hypothetical protein [Stellaceae bacterium]
MIGVALAAFVLAQAPQPGAAEALAGLYGRALGAASECQGIARERLEAAAQAAAAHVKALAKNGAAQQAAGAELARGVDRGSRDVKSGALTCDQAESEFGNLERDLAASR